MFTLENLRNLGFFYSLFSLRIFKLFIKGNQYLTMFFDSSKISIYMSVEGERMFKNIKNYLFSLKLRIEKYNWVYQKN